MKIPWKLKSQIFLVVEQLKAYRLLYLLQKYLTGRSRIALDTVAEWRKQLSELKEQNVGGIMFEFGAGKNLGQNLLLSPLFEQQYVVDLNPMLDFDLVNRTGLALAEVQPEFRYDSVHDKAQLNKRYGINYQAPYDARHTHFKDNSVDVCVSTNTLEHIPRQDIEAIFTEVYRILKFGGVVSAIIDYSDHYAHTDPSIGLLNFLQYSDEQWQRHNPGCHYQNRLRHYDFEVLFQSVGFEVVKNEPSYAEPHPPEYIAPCFNTQAPSLTATQGYFLLRKPDTNQAQPD
ncbi:hypothetical protein HMF8227_02239 [Saliniradius amylolyticus]|uniref:Methyltransferase type 11 domain-containing protein n=1 Tax=Saliniradius amylolyticus TaxID=2183582 RepID=A0A2S2E588_9ALTE|nr:class I SAM-dependent methyltransferase [Saliniradius amylolyticus]AWL12692.1 hypothetical protein HMF8227_02239 [Saliniradius amylolyticus]